MGSTFYVHIHNAANPLLSFSNVMEGEAIIFAAGKDGKFLFESGSWETKGEFHAYAQIPESKKFTFWERLAWNEFATSQQKEAYDDNEYLRKIAHSPNASIAFAMPSGFFSELDIKKDLPEGLHFYIRRNTLIAFEPSVILSPHHFAGALLENEFRIGTVTEAYGDARIWLHANGIIRKHYLAYHNSIDIDPRSFLGASSNIQLELRASKSDVYTRRLTDREYDLHLMAEGGVGLVLLSSV